MYGLRNIYRYQNVLKCVISSVLPQNNPACYKGWKKLWGISNQLIYNHARTCSSSAQISIQPAKVKDVLANCVEKLKNENVAEAELDAEYIISHVMGLPRRKLASEGSSMLSQENIMDIERMMTCRLARMPLQYILGEWDFRDIKLKVRPPVFIPRPETEQLVDLALECLQGILQPRVLEIGCGSGAISISLLHSREDIMCVAVDQSRHAIKLTTENANNIGVQDRLTMVEGKVKSDASLALPHNTYDLVVSNPPYVLRKDLMNLQPEIMLYEDLRALDGGPEGMDVIKGVLHLSTNVLPYNHCLLMEMDPCHAYLIPAWLEKQDKLKIKVESIYQDFCKKDRFIKCVKYE